MCQIISILVFPQQWQAGLVVMVAAFHPRGPGSIALEGSVFSTFIFIHQSKGLGFTNRMI